MKNEDKILELLAELLRRVDRHDEIIQAQTVIMQDQTQIMREHTDILRAHAKGMNQLNESVNNLRVDVRSMSNDIKDVKSVASQLQTEAEETNKALRRLTEILNAEVLKRIGDLEQAVFRKGA